jgi:hypothetical protein
MNKLLKILNKYIALLIVSSLFSIVWQYVISDIFASNDFELFNSIKSISKYVDYFIRIIITVLLIFDFKKHKLNHIILTCISALVYPLLGIVILSLLLLEKWKEKASA